MALPRDHKVNDRDPLVEQEYVLGDCFIRVSKRSKVVTEYTSVVGVITLFHRKKITISSIG